MARPPVRNIRKEKKSDTLSRELIRFLASLSKRRHVSVSSVLDEMTQNVRRAQERHTLDQAVQAYYSRLPDHEAQELEEWGNFAMSQFPTEDGSR